MKWNGRSYRPAKAQFYTKKKPFDFQEALKPYGEKELPVWQSIVAVNVPPQSTPTPPTPQCDWDEITTFWNNNGNQWDECAEENFAPTSLWFDQFFLNQ